MARRGFCVYPVHVESEDQRESTYDNRQDPHEVLPPKDGATQASQCQPAQQGRAQEREEEMAGVV